MKINKRYIYYTIFFVGLILLCWWFFRSRFARQLPIEATAFSVGQVQVRWYGLIIALSVILGYELFVKPVLKKNNINEDKFVTFLLVTVIFAIIGARLVFVLQDSKYYFSHFGEVFSLWRGGLSIHGALLFGLLSILWGAKYLRVGALRLADILSPAVIFGMGLGRLGNFFNQEIIGNPTSVKWKMFVDPLYRPSQYLESKYYHPVFLYEMVLDFILLAILLFLRKKNLRDGLIFIIFIGGYSIIRFVVEFWRYNEVRYFWHLSLAQIVSAILVIVSLATFCFLRKRK